MRWVAWWNSLRLRTKAMLVLSIPVVPLLLSAFAIVGSARQERAAQQWVTKTLL